MPKTEARGQRASNLIPPHLVPKLARETGLADHERTFSRWSQTLALMFAHRRMPAA